MKTALVTGASRGIGNAIAVDLLNNGYEVYGISRSEPQINNRNFHWIEFDLTNFDKYNDLLGQLPQKLDVLVNNAGIAYLVDIKNLLPIDIDRQIAINFKAPALLTKLLFGRLNQGIIINIASDAGIVPYQKYSIYGASKAALIYFSEAARTELNLKVYTIMPGDTDTPMSHTLMGPNANYKELLQPEQIATVIREVAQGKHTESFMIAITNKHLASEVAALPQMGIKVVNVDE